MTRYPKRAPVPETTDATCGGCAPYVQETPGTGNAAPTLQLDSMITCPKCGSETHAHMPADACQFFWDCPACGVVLRPKPGDCCVFCSWGDVPCPPVQAGRNGCG